MSRSRDTAAARMGDPNAPGSVDGKQERWEWWQIEVRRFAAELAPECQLLEQRALLLAVDLNRVARGQRGDQTGDPGTQLKGEMWSGARRELPDVAVGWASGEVVRLLGFGHVHGR